MTQQWSAKFDGDGAKKFTYAIVMEIGERELGKRRKVVSYFSPLGSAPGRDVSTEEERRMGFIEQLDTSLEMRRLKQTRDPATVHHVHRVYSAGKEGVEAFAREVLKIEEVRGATGQIRDGRYVFVL